MEEELKEDVDDPVAQERTVSFRIYCIETNVAIFRLRFAFFSFIQKAQRDVPSYHRKETEEERRMFGENVACCSGKCNQKVPKDLVIASRY